MTTSNGSNAAPTPAGRKRSQPDASPALDSSKKRKLDATANGPAPQSALNSITSAISSVFGYGRQPENGTNSGTPSEIGDNHTSGSAQAPAGASSAPRRPALKLAVLKGTIWDTEEKPRLKKAQTTAPKPRGRPKGSGNKARSQPKSPSASASVRRNQQKASLPEDSPTKPRSIQVTNESNIAKVVDREAADGSEDDDLPVDEPGTPVASQATLTGKRLFGPAASSPAPRGILTPTKNRGQTPKSVKFDKRVNSEMFFEDLPTDTTPKKTTTPRKPREKKDEVDEIVCGLCSRPNSKAPNQIILCDVCDFAVHQECYGVTEIPDGEWLCKSCDQADALVATPAKKSTPQEELATIPAADVPDIPNFEHHLRSLQRVLLDRCAGRRRINMFGQQDVHEKVQQLVEQTVVAGEGNSMLVIGARGSGKTTMLENIISDLSRDHRSDFHVVRLNGFIHTDDKLALKEIWRQLGMEMEVEDDLVNRTNYADTMASLLALLSHPSEIIGTDEGVTSQAVVFIIDEFDMFASHPRQTLLYNLFDIAQSRKAPIAVLGCTTRLDVVEMLEKRVKSRFSHRYVYLTLPRSLPAYWQVCKQGLAVERKDAENEGIDTSLEGYSEFHKYWNQKIDELYTRRRFQELLQYHYYSTKSAAGFFNEWVIPLATLSIANLTLEVPIAESELTSLSPPDSRLHLLATLSDLDLGLLIAAARLDIVAHTDNVNFAMAYDEYSSLVGRQRIQSSASGMLAVGGGVRVWSRGVAGIAWERLISLGLLVPSGIGGGKGHGGLDGRMWKVDVALEEIPAAVKLGSVLAKWCREL